MYKNLLIVAIFFGSMLIGTGFNLASGLEEGLIGWWPMDEGKGDVVYDGSGNDNDGDIFGDPKWADGKFGKALSFDGNDDYVSIENDVFGGDNNINGTIAFWVDIKDSTGNGKYFVQITRHARPAIYRNGHNIGVQWMGASGLPEGNGQYINGPKISKNAWHHIAFSWERQADGTHNWRLYADGRLTHSGTKATLSNSRGGVYLAANTGRGGFFNGKIDDVRIYNRALSENEIRTLAGHKSKTIAQRRSILFLGGGGGFSHSPRDCQIDEKYKKALISQGYELGWHFSWDDLTWEYIRRFNVIAMLWFPHAEKQGLPKKYAAKLDLFYRFLKEGGGILVLGTGEQDVGQGIAAQNVFLKPLGGEVLWEQVTDREKIYEISKSYTRSKFAYTSNISSSPVTKEVAGIWYNTYSRKACRTTMTNPVNVGSEWQVVIRGMKSSYSVKVSGTAGTYKESVPLVAIREYGRGRIVLWPMQPTCTLINGYHFYWGNGIVMDSEIEGKRSNGEKLLDNIFSWLSEPSFEGRTLGGYMYIEPKREGELGFEEIEWDKLQISQDFHESFMGLIGAHTELSSGKGSVAEFVTQAKRAGYKFIAFTEDFAYMTEEKWNKLVKACKENSTDDFQAYPGFEYVDRAGNSQIVFGNISWPKPDSICKEDKTKIRWNNSFFRKGYPPIIVIKSKSNSKRPWFLGNYKGFAIYTYDENNNLIDDSLDEYLYLQKCYYNLFPVSVHLVKNPTQVMKARETGYQTYIRANAASDILTNITGHFGPKFYYPTYISTGPVIEDFKVINFGTSDLAIPGNDRHRIQMIISSSVDLEEVKLMDGLKLFRCYKPKGKKFTKEIDNFHDRQHAYLLMVTDTKGDKAISWVCPTSVQEYYYLMCSDNWNTMSFGKWFMSKVKPPRGIEAYIWQAPNHYFFPTIYKYNGKKDELIEPYHHLSSRFDNLLSGRYGSVINHIIKDKYLEAPGNWTYSVYEQPQTPLEMYNSEVKVTFFTSRPDYPQVRLIEGKIVFKKSIELAKSRPFPIVVFNANNWNLNPGEYDHFSYIGQDGLKREILNPTQTDEWIKKSGRFVKGGYAACYPHIGGLIGVIALEPGLKYSLWRRTDATVFLVGIGEPGQKVSEGEEFRYKYLMVFGKLGIDPTDRDINWVWETMGLGGPPAYQIKPMIGEIVDTQYILKLRAKGGGFRGRISETHLPVDLPVMIEGLNERWDAAIWYNGKNSLYSPEYEWDDWGINGVDRKIRVENDQIFRFPIRDGVGYVQIDTEIGDKDIFMGNLLVSDQPEVNLSVIDIKRGTCRFIVHNPTDKDIVCKVMPAKGFDLIPEFVKELRVPAGKDIEVNIP